MTASSPDRPADPSPGPVLITGASGGLGQALAAEFARRGHPLVLHCHQQVARTEHMAEQIQRAGGTAYPLSADLSDPNKLTDFITSANTLIDQSFVLLIHAAGAMHDGQSSRLNEDQWQAVIHSHLTAASALIEQLRLAPGGLVALIGSGAGQAGRVGQIAYAAAKAGLEALTQSAARPLATKGVRINTVIPGPMETIMWQALNSAAQAAILQRHALDHLCQPQQVARFIATLMEFPSATGQTFHLHSRLPAVL